jgi:quercetin dioxygenase-like cupin family protein
MTSAATPTVTPVLATTAAADGRPIVAPPGPLEVTVTRVALPPGAALPVHRHPHLRMGYVLEGRLVVTDEGGRVAAYGPGEFGVEATGPWHGGRNDGPGTALVLVIDLAPPGEPNVVLREGG